MAIPNNKILLRSPYWVTQSSDDLDYMMIDLRVWNGSLADEPTDPTIQLRSTALNGVASIDIAELARDYVEVTFNGFEESNTVIISYQVTTSNVAGKGEDNGRTYKIGYDGYGTFADGYNPVLSSPILMSAERVSAYKETNIDIPVALAEVTEYSLQRLSYVGYSSFRTVSTTNTPADTGEAVLYIDTKYQGQYADRVEIKSGADVYYVYVDYQECNKYGVNKVYFVNRFGAVQQMHFSSKYAISLSSESEKYTRNLLDNGTYDVTRHQTYLLNKNGKFSMEINTGWIPEEENDTMIEILMSEQIWLKVDTSKLGVGWVPKSTSEYTIPVHLTNKNMSVKTKLNEKLINYSFKFEAANDWINTVR